MPEPICLHQRIGLFVKPGRDQQIAVRRGILGLHQFLAQNHGVGLSQDRFADGQRRRDCWFGPATARRRPLSKKMKPSGTETAFVMAEFRFVGISVCPMLASLRTRCHLEL